MSGESVVTGLRPVFSAALQRGGTGDFRLMIDDLKIQRTPSGVNGMGASPRCREQPLG